MAFNVKRTLEAMLSHIAEGGYVRSSQIGEPKAPPAAILSAALFMADSAVVATTLQDTIEVHTVTIRLHKKVEFTEPGDAAEFELANVSAEIASSFMGDFDLDGTIRNVDVAGQYGQGLTSTWGYLDIGSTVFRVVDILVPMIVDGSTTLVK